MTNTSFQNSKKSFWLLNLVWLMVTLAIITAALYFNWRQTELQLTQVLARETEHAREQIDSLFSRILIPILRLPLEALHPEECHEALLPALSSIEFNNPNISGVVVSGLDGQVLCATISKATAGRVGHSETTRLHGPVTLDANDKPAFMLQSRQGNYYITIFVLQLLLERALTPGTPDALATLLYDEGHHTTLLRVSEKSPLTGPEALAENEALRQIASRPTQSTTPEATRLQSVEKVLLYVSKNPENFNRQLIFSSSLLVLATLLLSALLYQAVRNMLKRRFSLEGLIQNGIRNHAFYPVYLPTFDLKHNAFCGAEMLARWQDAPEGVSLPNVFIPEAERSGLIVPMTLQLMETALADCKSLFEANAPFYLAINLSAGHFADRHFFDTLETLCKRHHVRPEQLMFEITERELFDTSNGELRKSMENLRAKGFQLAVDDFGTGHASIRYLQHFPFNYLKIDQSFIQAIGTGALTETLIVPIVDMARKLQLEIVAEGVETHAQCNYLKSLGITCMQGWLYSKPLHAKALNHLLEENRHA